MSLAKLNYLDDNFDENNIMVAMEDIEKYFQIFKPNKLTLLTVKKVLHTYQDLINELDLYETKYESIIGLSSEAGSKRLFLEQPIILHDKSNDLTKERFIVLGGKTGNGKGSSAAIYNSNNNAKAPTFIASESFLKDKLSMVNFKKIISDCEKENLYFKLENEDIVPVKLKSIYSKAQFKLCAELINLNNDKTIYLSALDNELIFEDNFKTEKIGTSTHSPKKRTVNVSKYLKEV